MDSYADRLSAAILDKDSRVCVGLDPRIEALPAPLADMAGAGPEEAARAYREFCCEIIEAIAQYAPAVKPQAAFFEALGPAGYAALWDVITHAGKTGLLVILDAKRSDIGSTAAAYAQAYFRPGHTSHGPDAVTVNGYLGGDGIAPFVQAATECGGGIYVLAKTSNPSSGQLQDLACDAPGGVRRVYEHMGSLIAEWGREHIGAQGYSAVGAVVGATYPEQLHELRAALPSVQFLVPGYGAQGAGAPQVVGAFDARGLGAVVNSSRGIIFAYQGHSQAPQSSHKAYAQAAAHAAAAMRDAINEALAL